MDVRIVAIAALTILESVALLKEIDGAFLLPIVAVIAGLGGYSICEVVKKQKGCGK